MSSFSGFWDTTGDNQPHSFLINRNPVNRRLMKALRRKSTKTTRAILDSISTSNTAAEVTHTRALATPAEDSQGNPVVNGGVRTIETVTLRNGGNVTVEEVDNVHTFTRYDAQPTYPGDTADVAGGKQMGELIAPRLG